MLSSQPCSSSISLLPMSTRQSEHHRFPLRHQTDNLIIDASTVYSGHRNVRPAPDVRAARARDARRGESL